MSAYSEFTAISTVSYGGRLVYLSRSINSKSLGVVSSGISISAWLVPARSRYRAKNRTDIFKTVPPFDASNRVYIVLGSDGSLSTEVVSHGLRN